MHESQKWLVFVVMVIIAAVLLLLGLRLYTINKIQDHAVTVADLATRSMARSKAEKVQIALMAYFSIYGNFPEDLQELVEGRELEEIPQDEKSRWKLSYEQEGGGSDFTLCIQYQDPATPEYCLAPTTE